MFFCEFDIGRLCLIIEIYLSNAGERRNRVLAEDIKGTRSEAESIIKQVTNEEGKHAGLQERETKREKMPTRFHRIISKTQSVNQVASHMNLSARIRFTSDYQKFLTHACYIIRSKNSYIISQRNDVEKLVFVTNKMNMDNDSYFVGRSSKNFLSE